MQNRKFNNPRKMELGALKSLLSELTSEMGEDTEIWLSCDEEGNEFLPMSANSDLSVVFDPDSKRIIFFPMHYIHRGEF